MSGENNRLKGLIGARNEVAILMVRTLAIMFIKLTNSQNKLQLELK